MKKGLILLVVCILLALLPIFIKSVYLSSVVNTFFIYVIIGESWNLLGGFTGQISLGHAAFFGIGALITRLLWVGHVPFLLSLIAGGLSSALLAVFVGIPCFRIKQAYFPIGTLSLGMIALLAVGNLFPVPGALPKAFLDAYNSYHRYYLSLAIAILTVAVLYYLVRSRPGLAMLAIRDNEKAAGAMGARTLKYKVLSLVVSSFLAGLAGGLYAFQHVSYYYESTFDLGWSFNPALTTYIGGLGTLAGPIVGSFCFILLSEIFAHSLGQVHVVIFGFCFILIVLFFPGGLMSIRGKAFRFLKGGKRHPARSP